MTTSHDIQAVIGKAQTDGHVLPKIVMDTEYGEPDARRFDLYGRVKGQMQKFGWLIPLHYGGVIYKDRVIGDFDFKIDTPQELTLFLTTFHVQGTISAASGAVKDLRLEEKLQRIGDWHDCK